MLQSSAQTTAGLFDFTTVHAAPELLEGGETSAATDVYELASTLYELIAGRPAFRAYDGESSASVILRFLRDPVRPIADAQIPLALSDLLIRAMSKDTAGRPATAAEFASELSKVETVCGWPRTQFLIRGQPASTPADARRNEITQLPAPMPILPRKPKPASAVELPKLAEEPTRQPPAPQLDSGVPPAPNPARPGATAPAVPRWAVRSPAALPITPQLVGNLAIDPLSLRPRLKLRSRSGGLRVDDGALVIRRGLHRERLSWPEISRFEPHFPDGVDGTVPLGVLVAITRTGAVELPATTRPVGELPYLHALLDAYRIRAQARVYR